VQRSRRQPTMSGRRLGGFEFDFDLEFEFDFEFRLEPPAEGNRSPGER
jgi:hypothetical protein